ARRHTKAEVEMLAGDASLGGYVFERSVSLIAQQAIVEGGVGLLQFRQICAVAEEDVHPAVVVEIQNGDTSAHGLRAVFPPRVVVVRDVSDPGTRSDVREVRTSGRGSHSSPRSKHGGDNCGGAEHCGNRTERHWSGP